MEIDSELYDYRNRRIGEFLKGLNLTEGRGTKTTGQVEIKAGPSYRTSLELLPAAAQVLRNHGIDWSKTLENFPGKLPETFAPTRVTCYDHS
jgi:hypothetical protein